MAERIAINADDIELLSRYIDGELDIVATDRLEARLESDPTLRNQLAALRRNDVLLTHALSTGAATRIPVDVTAALSRPNNIVRFPTAKRMLTPLAAAASIAVAVTALLLQPGPDSGDVVPDMDHQLAAALESIPSRADGWDTLSDNLKLRAVLTFPAADGRWCREFLVANDEKHWRGVACRDNDTWVTQVIGSEVFLEQETQYRTAGVKNDMSVARFIDRTAADVALGPDEERSLIASEWKAATQP